MEVLTRKRLTREESRAQTRERLIESAHAIFVKEGIDAASIEDVAEAAGYSRGAFYSNFESKDELLCAVLQRKIERDTREFEAILAAIPAEGLIGKLREYYVEMGRNDSDCALWLGVQLYALRNPTIKPQVADMLRKKREDIVALVRQVYSAIGQEPPGSVEIVTLGLIAIAQGLAITRMLDQEAIPAEMLPQSLETFFNQITGAAIT